MATQMRFALSMNEDAARQLRAGAQQLGASEAELVSIKRLAEGRGHTIDVERLGPLAVAIGLPWEDMWRAFL